MPPKGYVSVEDRLRATDIEALADRRAKREKTSEGTVTLNQKEFDVLADALFERKYYLAREGRYDEIGKIVRVEDRIVAQTSVYHPDRIYDCRDEWENKE